MSAEPKWTPGPLIAFQPVESNGYWYLSRAGEDDADNIATYWGAHGNAEADAKRSAAAPDLYEALDVAIILLRNRDQTETEARVVAAGKAALARARGDQP